MVGEIVCYESDLSKPVCQDRFIETVLLTNRLLLNRCFIKPVFAIPIFAKLFCTTPFYQSHLVEAGHQDRFGENVFYLSGVAKPVFAKPFYRTHLIETGNQGWFSENGFHKNVYQNRLNRLPEPVIKFQRGIIAVCSERGNHSVRFYRHCLYRAL